MCSMLGWFYSIYIGAARSTRGTTSGYEAAQVMGMVECKEVNGPYIKPPLHSVWRFEAAKPTEQIFCTTLLEKLCGKDFEVSPNLLNALRIGDYLPDRVSNLILQYLSNSLSKTTMYNLLQPRLDVVLFEIIFPLMCFNDNDQALWEEDLHEYH